MRIWRNEGVVASNLERLEKPLPLPLPLGVPLALAAPGGTSVVDGVQHGLRSQRLVLNWCRPL